MVTHLRATELPATWYNTVLPATRHKWTCLALTPTRQAVNQFTTTEGSKAELTLVLVRFWDGLPVRRQVTHPHSCHLTGSCPPLTPNILKRIFVVVLLRRCACQLFVRQISDDDDAGVNYLGLCCLPTTSPTLSAKTESARLTPWVFRCLFIAFVYCKCSHTKM